MSRELEVLANNLMNSNPSAAESYIAYGHLARHRRCNKEAPQFSQHAVTLASVTFNGRLKAESLLLRAIIYFDSKNNEAETCLQEALINDNTNLEVYDTYVRYLVHQVFYISNSSICCIYYLKNFTKKMNTKNIEDY